MDTQLFFNMFTALGNAVLLLTRARFFSCTAQQKNTIKTLQN